MPVGRSKRACPPPKAKAARAGGTTQAAPHPYDAAVRGIPPYRLANFLFWATAGILHFGFPRFYEPIVPPPFNRRAREVVLASGFAETFGALLVLPARTRRFARRWLLATLVAVYPANIYMALRPERFPRFPRWSLWARLPLQGVFAWLTWKGTE